MSLELNKEMLAHMYDYLCATPPFNTWNMPPSEEVVFKVAKTRHRQGWYQWDGKQHTITASAGRVSYSYTLVVLLAHEMIHLHLEDSNMESKATSNDVHNAAFRVLADKVCKVHGFDPKAFY